MTGSYSGRPATTPVGAATGRRWCASLPSTMASAQTQMTIPQRLAAIREQMSLLSDYL
jgi:hypothetical protein